MGDQYVWRGGNGAFDASGQWNDLSTDPQQYPAHQPPSSSDHTEFSNGGTVSGDGDVNSILVAGASVTFTGNITATNGFTAGQDATVAFDGGGLDVGIADLMIADGSSGTIAAATVNGGAVFVQGADLQILSGGAVSLTAGAGGFSVGVPESTANPSTLELENGGSITDTVALVGGVSGASATVTGGIWSSASGMAVGIFGNGTLAISSGGTVSTGDGGALAIGALNGTSGTVTVSGSNSMLVSNYATDVVGGQGSGDLTINGGGTANVSGTLDVGVSAAAQGTLVVTDSGSTLSVGDALIIGDGGTGTGMFAAGASASVSNGLTIGNQGGGSGTLSVTDAGTQLSADGGAAIGASGNGELDVQSGAVVLLNSGSVVIGAAQGGTGTVTVSGSNSTLSAGNGMTIGALGSGTLSVTNGAAVDAAGGITVGVSAGVSGSVSVTGAESTLEDGGSSLVIGQAGTGALLVNDGTFELLSGGITLGVSAAAAGSMTMEDTGLTLFGSVDVGDGGYASLKLINNGTGGASLSATGLILGGQADSLGTMTVDGSGSAFDSSTAIIGNDGWGGIKVSGSAVVTTTGDVLAAAGGTGSQGTISLDSNGQWLIGGLLAIGQAGTAGMKVADGAAFSAGAIDLGVDTLAAGTLSIAGNTLISTIQPSVMQFGTALNVGVNGSGLVKFGGGATLESGGPSGGNIIIGVSAGASGTISMSGSGDLLTGNQLSVGSGFNTTAASGLLSIGSGETVSVNSGYVAASGVVAMSGGDLIAPSLGVDGTISGSGSIIGTLGIGAGSIVASSGSLEITGPVGSLLPGLYIGDTGTLQFDSTIAAGAQIIMGSTKSVLVINDFPDYQNAIIQSFGTGEKILLPLLDANKGKVVGNELELELQVVNNGTTVVNNGSTVVTGGTTISTVEGSLAFSGMSELSTLGFKVSDAVGTGTTVTVACFAQGTRIRTGRGDVAVEDLREGDLVWSVTGERYEPVRWIGYRHVDCRAHPRPETVWPVVMSAGSFGPGLPLRDLALSPDHAVYANEVLVPVKHLINATTIRQVKVDRITYYHVELEQHDVLLADGLPAESYLDVGDRANFANGGAVVRVHIDLALHWEAGGCAPLIVYGPELEEVKQMVAAHTEAHRHCEEASAAR